MNSVLELKKTTAWDSVASLVLPTENLTPSEIRRLQAREDIIDAAILEARKPEVYLKINHGIFRGSIFRVATGDKGVTLNLHVANNAKDMNDRIARDIASKSRYPTELSDYTGDKPVNKSYQFSQRTLSFSLHFFYHATGDRIQYMIIRLKDGWIFPGFLGSDIINGMSLLIGYQGPEVFVINEEQRSLVFRDRLDQEVTVGDLVVVALNNGQGLDVCMVRGFADAERVVIESVQDKSLDRITIKDDSTNKIMRMPNSLKDTALMMKLAS